MNQPPQAENNNCLNCNSILSTEDHFCPACGQKRTTGKITFKQLLADFFDNVFNLDSRVFQTARNFFSPGELTLEYFKGKHRTYLHPFRIFLIAVIAMIASINWMLNDGINKEGDLMVHISNARIQKNLFVEIDSLNELYRDTTEEESLSAQLDSLKKEVYRKNGIKGDSVDLDRYFTIANEDYKPILIEDVFKLNAEEMIQKYNITGWKRKYIFRQKIKVLRDSRSFLRFLIGRISWMALILIPLLAFCLKLFYWRKDFYYVEHFIFSLHTHSVFFLLIAITVPFLNWFPVWIICFPFIAFTAYILLAMRRFYQQGWWKTIIKFTFLFMVAYQVCILFSLMIALVLGIFLF